MTGLFETTAETMVQAYAAGAAYWLRNKPYKAAPAAIQSLGRSSGWHDAENNAFVEGFFEAKKLEAAGEQS